jgi:hypothetical protein
MTCKYWSLEESKIDSHLPSNAVKHEAEARVGRRGRDAERSKTSGTVAQGDAKEGKARERVKTHQNTSHE